MDLQNELRVKCKKERDALSKSTVLTWSSGLCRHLIAFPKIQEAENLLLYYPLGKEASLLSLLPEFFGKKHLFFPVTVKDGGLLFFEPKSPDDFEKGHFGVMEPASRDQVFSSDVMYGKTIALVPGVAFDRKMSRMGYGKGYYDRFFAQSGEIYKIGICFSMQIVKEIVANPWDVPMDVLCSEKGLLFGAS